MASGLREWVIDRFGLKPIAENFVYRRVPTTPWYYGDGSSMLLLFGVLIVTGALMSLTYTPTPDAAFDSVWDITHHQTLGWFIRGLHYWSAGFFVVMLFFHLFRQILVAGYKFPREGTWLLGVLMFFGFLAMSFTGYTLRWDERSIYAIKVVLRMFHFVPLIGDPLVQFVQGGPELGARTLTRFYSVHVIWLPLLLLGLASYHLYLIVLRGVTSPAERRQPIETPEQQKEVYHQAAYSETEGETFHPYTTFKSGAMATVVLAIAVVFTLVYGPAELYPEGNLIDPSMPAEEWWFWWYSGLIALLPSAIAPTFMVLFPVLLFIVLVTLPFVDRGRHRGMKKRPIAVVVVVVCAIALVALSDYRRRSPFTGWPDPEPPPVPQGVKLTERAEEGRQLFARFGCNSCHPIAGHGPEVGTDLARLAPGTSLREIRNYVLRPPPGIPMPPYEEQILDGRMTEEQLDLVSEFVHVIQLAPRKQ